MVKVEHVTMRFRMVNDKVMSLKEYVVAVLKRRLQYKEFTVLDDISFDVKKGEVVGIIGRNGAGKSTLLKIISGVLQPTEGTVETKGNIVPMLELGSGFDLDLSGRENIFLNGSISVSYTHLIIGDVPSHERNCLMKECFGSSIRSYTVPKISDILLSSSAELNIFDSPLYLSRNEDLKVEQKFFKRLIDILFSSLGLIVTSPFWAVISLMIKCSDRGPVFYKQLRLTKDGKVFEIYKFRTMVQNAEEDGVARLASESDDRILPVGRFLRMTRLDELPQLINILKGEMSVVGPRPERPELAAEIEKEIPEFAYRLKVKAGLTGYAQVYGKYNTTAYDKLKLDLTYIRKYSVFLDLKLILMTPKIMLLKESTEGVKESPAEQSAREEAAASSIKD